MSIARFEDLCVSLCEVAAVAPPDLAQDERGFTAFTITSSGVATTIMQHRDTPDSIAIACSLGAVGDEDDHRACRAVLAINFMMLGEPMAPCVARDPVTGEFVLHYTSKLQDASGASLYQAVVRMVKAAQAWRNGALLRTPANAGDLLAIAGHA
jgi:hypothetical protein